MILNGKKEIGNVKDDALLIFFLFLVLQILVKIVKKSKICPNY